MTEPDANDRTDSGLAAGDFEAWITGMQAALRGEQESDVPCGTCTACCTSSRFVHIAAAATPLAVFAVRVHDAFVHEDESTGELTLVQPDPASVQAALTVAQRDAG